MAVALLEGLQKICYLVMENDIRDSTGTNEEHSSLKLSVYSTFTFISKLDKTRQDLINKTD